MKPTTEGARGTAAATRRRCGSDAWILGVVKTAASASKPRAEAANLAPLTICNNSP